jgi:GntR family transcriptional regulator
MINIRYFAPMPDDAIDLYADEPLYVQLAGIVRRMIEKGDLAHLDPVPSESSLVQTYGVSRDTARRAMALLRDEGVVFTVPHRGTYVGPRPKLRRGRKSGQAFGRAFDVGGRAGVGRATVVPEQHSPVGPYRQIGVHGDDAEDVAGGAVDPSYAVLAQHLGQRADHVGWARADGAGGSGKETS